MTYAIPPYVNEYLSKIDEARQPTSDVEITEAISQLRKANPTESREEMTASWVDMLAFNFRLSFDQESQVWGLPFNPSATGTRKDGTVMHFPDADEITPEIIGHWQKRAKEFSHPVLKARYHDLLWVFTNRVTKARPDISHARAAIDSYIAIVDENLYDHPMTAIRYVERAAVLAKSISEDERLEVSKKVFFALHEKIRVPQQVGTWAFLYDILLEDKLIFTSDEEQKAIVQYLELVLEECADVANGDKFDPFAAQEAGERLSEYYRKWQRLDDAKRVTLQWGGAFEEISKQADGSLAMTWLQTVFEAYREHGLTEDAKRVQLAAREKGKSATFKEVSGSVKFTQAELDQYFTEMTDGGFERALTRIAGRFVPRIKDAKDQLQKIQREAPLVALIPRTLISDGQVVGRVGSIEEDPEGRLVLQISERIGFGSIFLQGSFDALKEKYQYKFEDIERFVLSSPLFLNDRKSLVRDGIRSWFEKDFVKAIHVLLPQIEHALRVMLGMLGQPTNKFKRSGVMEEVNLNDILANQAIKEALKEDVQLYLRVLLADQRGYNLRNLVSHGLQPAEMFTEDIGNRLFQVISLLSLIQFKEAGEEIEGDSKKV